VLLSAAAVLCAVPALSQEPSRWEIGAFGGGYFGTRISLTPDADTRIGNGPSFGLRGAFFLNPHFRLEGSFSRASISVNSFDPVSGALQGPGQPGHVETYELGLLYGFGSRWVRGYFGLGAGAMTLPSLGAGFEASVAAGVEIPFDERFGLRFDGRYRWRESNRRIGAIVCEGASGCFPFTTTLYSSAEVSGGLTYRFGDGFRGEGFSLFGDGAPEQKRFWAAAFELTSIVMVSFSINKWGSKYDWAAVTPSSLADNFQTGFTYDRDPYYTNQFLHALHGNYYFNVARSNGYDFWESGIFAFIGSFVWECCTEIEPASINDQLNTTLGGMQMGEIAHRLAGALLDNTAHGAERVFRELGGLVLDPAGNFNRFLQGDLARVGPNPPDRLPSRLRLDADLGYRHLEGDATSPDQGLLRVSVLYGNPFEGEIHKPFDSFTMGLEIASAGATLTRFEDEGLLRGWDVAGDASSSKHVFGLLMGFAFVDNELETFGTQALSAGLLSRFPLGSGLHLETKMEGSVFPLAAIKTQEAIDPLAGRNYDYAPGGGVRVGAVLFRSGRQVAEVTYGVGWFRTVDGTASMNTLQSLRAMARLPLGEAFGLGAAYQWFSRDTSYARTPSNHATQSEWRIFLTRSI
jgi:hypothetical protein